jgi:hypothetical protein
MIVVWLLVGIVAVSVAFFIPPNSPELWPALNAAAIPVIVYILALAFYTLRSPITRKARIIAWVSILLVGGASYTSWTGMNKQSHWQHDKLLQIHAVIYRGVLQARVPENHLKTLEAYHSQGSRKKETLAQVFQRLNEGAAVGTNIYKPEMPNDSLSIVVQSLSENQVVLLGLHAYSKGRNPEFKNYGGRTGMIQEKYTLTEKGIVYESEN